MMDHALDSDLSLAQALELPDVLRLAPLEPLIDADVTRAPESRPLYRYTSGSKGHTHIEVRD